MDLVEMMEGPTRLLVRPGGKDRGPGARGAAVFFNPAMAFSRDVGVLAVAATAAERGRTIRALDGLAAGGARGVRYAAEAGAEVTLNDWDPAALDLARRNAEANGVRVRLEQRNLGALLWEERWDFVDVDPFGSPATFVDAATRAVAHRGVLAVTATDTAALYGLYPEVCRRRYLADPLHTEFGHETALRILAGFVARQAAKHDVAVRPALSHATDHYYRVYVRTARGAERANEVLASIGFAWACAACAARGAARDAPRECSECDGPVRSAGPLWTGPLHDGAFLESLAGGATGRALARPTAVARHLALWEAEAAAPPLFYDAHAAASRAKVDPWPLPALVEALRRAGFAASRTHASPHAVKTDATAAELGDVLRAGGRAAAAGGYS